MVDYFNRHKLYDYAEVNLNQKKTEDLFTAIYQQQIWMVNSLNSVSGDGSDLIQTERIRKWLPECLKKLEAKTFLDIPCGDFYWMKEVNLGNINYIGADIVAPLVEYNKINYSNARRAFSQLNLLSDPLPFVDVIFCRDCLVHFSFADILKALKNFQTSGSRYLITTSFPLQPVNYEIVTGGWRPLNLVLPPFNFPAPDSIFNEGCSEMHGAFHDKSLAIWSLNQIKILL